MNKALLKYIEEAYLEEEYRRTFQKFRNEARAQRPQRSCLSLPRAGSGTRKSPARACVNLNLFAHAHAHAHAHTHAHRHAHIGTHVLAHVHKRRVKAHRNS